MNHKNFVNLIGFCEENEPFTRMMVFEYAPNGTLFEHLHSKYIMFLMPFLILLHSQMNWSSDCSYILLDHQINMAFYRTALIISVKKKSVPALVQSMNNSVDFFFFHRAEICISKEELDCSYPFGTL
jgi:hypothetical protein